MKKFIYMALATIVALSSCSDNEMTEGSGFGNGNDKQPLVFTATTEGAPQVRATFDNTHKCASWEVNDRISINGAFFYASAAGTSTTFMAPATEEIRPTFMYSHSGSNEGESPSMLVDDKGTSTKWCANLKHRIDALDYDAWDIVLQTDVPIKLKSIKLWNGNDTYTHPGRRWKNIRVWGAETWAYGEDHWEEIKTFENLNLANEQNDLFAGELEVNSTKAYKYYMLDVSEVVDGDYMQMSDMKFVYDLNEGGNRSLSMDDAPFHAYFPSSLFDGTTAALPAHINEEWADGKFNMPMYAFSETTNLKFKNLCGVLKINIKNDDIPSVKSIRVSSANCATSGKFTVKDNAAVLDDPTDVSQNVTVTYSTPIETNAEGKVFYVAIPAQTYQDLLIKISDGVNDKYMITKSGADIVVERNKIYPIDFANNYDLPLQGTKTATINGMDVEVPWVQLWDEGPKFAAYNVGVTDGKPESYGGYYAAGGIQDKVDDHYNGSGDIPAEFDTATRLWGNNWRMPTNAEMKGLIDNCNVERNVVIGQHIGVRFTGKGAYSNCSLFLPAAGRCSSGSVYNDYANDKEGWSGEYWTTTSTPLFPGIAWHCLQINRDKISVESDFGLFGKSVRAVVK